MTPVRPLSSELVLVAMVPLLSLAVSTLIEIDEDDIIVRVVDYITKNGHELRILMIENVARQLFCQKVDDGNLWRRREDESSEGSLKLVEALTRTPTSHGAIQYQ